MPVVSAVGPLPLMQMNVRSSIAADPSMAVVRLSDDDEWASSDLWQWMSEHRHWSKMCLGSELAKEEALRSSSTVSVWVTPKVLHFWVSSYDESQNGFQFGSPVGEVFLMCWTYSGFESPIGSLNIMFYIFVLLFLCCFLNWFEKTKYIMLCFFKKYCNLFCWRWCLYFSVRKIL